MMVSEVPRSASLAEAPSGVSAAPHSGTAVSKAGASASSAMSLHGETYGVVGKRSPRPIAGTVHFTSPPDGSGAPRQRRVFPNRDKSMGLQTRSAIAASLIRREAIVSNLKKSAMPFIG